MKGIKLRIQVKILQKVNRIKKEKMKQNNHLHNKFSKENLKKTLKNHLLNQYLKIRLTNPEKKKLLPKREM